ncbi:MAG: acyl-CoA dehydrogenase [Rhodospirillales bacterium]|nr:acyl-CoA dehydrogenase [Rhodospirillales bacterium]
MDFELTVREIEFQEEFASWLRENMPDEVPPPGPERVRFLREWQRRLHGGRWVGLNYPREFGGREAGIVEMMLFYEELARQRAPDIIGLANVRMLGQVLLSFGTEEQKNRFIPPLLAADELWCQGFSEPDAGSDLAALRTRGEISGDEIVVTGHKVWTTLAHVADWCFALVRTGSPEDRHRGLTFVLIPMNAPGITVCPLRQITGDSDFNEVHFDNVRVPLGNVVGEVGSGWPVAGALLGHERGSTFFGTQIKWRRTLDDLYALCVRHGTGELEVARLRLRLDAMRYTALRALSASARGARPGPENSVLKVLRGRFEQEIYKTGAMLQGWAGGLAREATDSVDSARWQFGFMQSRMSTLAAGTTEIQYNILAEKVLKLPKG